MATCETLLLRKITQVPKPHPRYRKSSKSRKNHEESDDDVFCEKCGSGEHASQLLLCDKCDKGYHLFCLRPILVSVPKGSWFCPNCYSHKDLTACSLVQTKIVDFFRIKRPLQSDEVFPQDYRKKRRRSSGLVLSKKRRRLLPFKPSEDPSTRLEQMASLAAALKAVGAEYINKLTYPSGMAPRSSNRAVLEREGMQIMSKEDVETINSCKSMMEIGQCPPLMVVYDSREGFTVEADRFIRDMTIITEYVGDVDYLKNRENYKGDSMMSLLCASDPSKNLVICPDKRSNIARFINGINNHTVEGKKKQNVKCVRFNVDGECRVLLIANKDIAKGERLYYDYNGYEHQYPTQHFL